jgi:cytochrome c oxidase cbb3-type subunit 1
MWVAGIMQGLLWREFGADGYLVNSFAEVVAAMHPMYLIRATGGLMYLSGALIFAFNIAMTIAGKIRVEKPMTETPYNAAVDRPLVLQAAE